MFLKTKNVKDVIYERLVQCQNHKQRKRTEKI